jgi:acetyl esterase/lipase
MKRNVFSILIVSILLFSCQKSKVDPVAPPVVPPVGIAASTLTNVAYGTDALQKMDVYLPAGRSTTTTKVLILVHGGSWFTGDKSDFAFILDSLKKRLPDYAILNLNYRLALTFTTTFPTQELDVKLATDFINSKRSEYIISDKFVILGFSAGSHLAMLQAYKNPVPKIKAVVDFFGPIDMVDMYNNPAQAYNSSDIALLFNTTTPSTNLTLYRSSSPINYVDAQSPPTVIFHGTVDTVVRIQQSIRLDSLLGAKGVIKQYFPTQGQGHGWFGVPLSNSLNQMQAFLTTNVQ